MTGENPSLEGIWLVAVKKVYGIYMPTISVKDIINIKVVLLIPTGKAESWL